MALPLDGIRVLDLGTMTPGKYCSYLLTALGAATLRIERPGAAAPVEIEDLALNRGKRSMTLNLREPRGRDILLALAAGADVVLEGNRPGSAARLGIDYAALRADNPGLVYCALSGFGQTGPARTSPAYDLLFMSLSGMLTALTGAERPPTPPATFLADGVAGLTAALAISAALAGRAKEGAGRYIDLAMFDAIFGLLAVSHGTEGGDGRSAGAESEAIARRPLYDIYQAGDDRYLALSAIRPASAAALFERLGRPELTEAALAAEDPAAEGAAHVAAFLAETFRTRPAADWVAELGPLDIEIGAVASPAGAYDDAQLTARGMVAEARHPEAGTLRQIVSPIRFGDAAPAALGPAPTVGQDTDQVLAELGHDAASIAALRADGVI